MTWSVCTWCSVSRFFTSRCQLCDWTNIGWVTIENPRISGKISCYFTATQWISVRLQIWKQGVAEWLKLHNLRTDDFMIHWDLRYLIGAKCERLKPRSGYNPDKKGRVIVRSGSQPCQDKVGSVFCQVCNQTEPFGLFKPKPLACYPERFLTLVTIGTKTAVNQALLFQFV